MPANYKIVKKKQTRTGGPSSIAAVRLIGHTADSLTRMPATESTLQDVSITGHPTSQSSVGESNAGMLKGLAVSIFVYTHVRLIGRDQTPKSAKAFIFSTCH